MKNRCMKMVVVVLMFAITPVLGMHKIAISNGMSISLFIPTPRTDLGVFTTAESRIALNMRDMMARQQQLNCSIKDAFNTLRRTEQDVSKKDKDIVTLARKNGVNRYKEVIIPIWTKKYSRQFLQQQLSEQDYAQALEQELATSVDDNKKIIKK